MVRFRLLAAHVFSFTHRSVLSMRLYLHSVLKNPTTQTGRRAAMIAAHNKWIMTGLEVYVCQLFTLLSHFSSFLHTGTPISSSITDLAGQYQFLGYDFVRCHLCFCANAGNCSSFSSFSRSILRPQINRSRHFGDQLKINTARAMLARSFDFVLKQLQPQ